ncbi:AGAP010330-PA [Anopheles gambiae str. PEST]|uniref:AGAP010330-PA n=1 Tax=Anopheles gambiae TaxID=7165 RepID=Q7Q2I5_ANOGA|nr:AGAP010330-PA [Anopheles gambiae str. PEST]
MDRKFETTYSQDYTHRLENRQLALNHKIDANLLGSCFSPPVECTVPVFSMDNRAGESPLKSSYQLDYDRLPERTSCVIKNAVESSRWPDSRYFQREFKGLPCNGASCQSSTRGPHQICSHEPEVETKKKSKFGCVYTISNIPKSYIISSHWPDQDWQRSTPNMTEYRDKVGRLGRTLQRENIHDHSCCTSVRNCHHHFFL